MARLMAACGYDAMTAGNHDWNYGKERLKTLEGIVDEQNETGKGFSVLAGNVVTEDNTRYFEDEFLIKEIDKDGKTLKIGVFGVIDPRLYKATAPGNVEGLIFDDMTAYSEQAAQELRAQGCQIVIGIAHCILPLDASGIANTVQGVDLWLSGHEHMVLDSKSETTGSVTTEAGSHLEGAYDISMNCVIGADGSRSDLEIERNYITAASAGNTYEADENVQEVLDSILAAQSRIKNTMIGRTPVTLDGVWENVRIGETAMGRAVTSAYLKETGADIAIENAGGIRAGIAAGDVTYGQALDVFPFGNYVVTRSLTGAQIREMLQKSLEIQLANMKAYIAGDYDGWPANSGQVLQAGGLMAEYTYQDDMPLIKSIRIGGDELQYGKTYLVAANSYLVTDQENYPALAGKENVNEYGACEDILSDYLSQDSGVIAGDLNTPALVYEKMSQQPLTLNGMKEAVTYGDPGFKVNAAGGTTGNTVTYASSNPDAAEVDADGNVTIKGIGKTEISASMEGNILYSDVKMVQPLTVKAKEEKPTEPSDKEDIDKKDPPKNTEMIKENVKKAETVKKTVKTGDDTAPELYALLAAAAVICIAGAVIVTVRRRKK